LLTTSKTTSLLRNKYTKEIRNNKKDTWQKFVTIEGNKNPWSIPYKIARDKLKISDVACSIVLPSGGQTRDWSGSINALLQKVASLDDTSTENEEQKEIRRLHKSYVNLNVEEEITFEEI